MLDYLDNSSSYLNKTTTSNSTLGTVGLSAYSASTTDTSTSIFEDQSSISDDALSMYLKEQDIQKFTNMVMEDCDDTEVNQTVADMLEDGEYTVSDDDLAESMIQDSGFMSSMFDVEA